MLPFSPENTSLRFFAFACLFLLSGTLAAQNQPMNQTTSDWLDASSRQLAQVPNSMPSFNRYSKQLLGSPYEDSTFQTGHIRFYKRVPGTQVDSLIGVPIRHDLLSKHLEILAGPNNIRVAQAPQVRQFAVNSPSLNTATYYLNVREFGGEAESLSGFFEVLTVGRATLLRYPSANIKKANYNVAMSVGNKDDEVLLTQDWYAAVSWKAVAFTPSKRSLLALMEDKKGEMEAYLKNQKPDLKSRAGLMAAFAHYNSL